MTYDADTPRGEFGPEELALNDWLDDLGPYLALPDTDEPDGDDDQGT